jgi:hypothetical protein
MRWFSTSVVGGSLWRILHKSTSASPPSGLGGSKRPRSSRKSPRARRKGRRGTEIRYGKSVQEDIVLLLSDMDGKRVYNDRNEFRKLLESVFKGFLRIPPHFWDVMMDALSEREE